MLALFLTEKLPSPPPPSSNKFSLPRNEAGQGLGPLPVPVGLPPVGVILADHVQDVATLTAEHQLFPLFLFLGRNFSFKDPALWYDIWYLERDA